MKVDKNTRMILVRFTIQNLKTIPGSIPLVERETTDELHERKEGYVPGIETIERTEDCSVIAILDDIAQLGFELVGAFHKPMIHYRPRKKQTYYQVRLTFVRHEDVKQDMHEGFKQSRPQILLDILRLCQEALWRVRVFDNPFFRNGDMDSKGRCACITLEARKPFHSPDGQPVTQWHKDETGNRIGDTPVPITAKYQFRIVYDTIQLVPA